MKRSLSVKFQVRYPGSAASSNHGYAIRRGFTRDTGREFHGLRLTKEAVAFKEVVFWAAKQAFMLSTWRPQPGDKLRVAIRGRFPNKVHSDVANLQKFIVDSVEAVLNSYVTSGPLHHNDRDWATGCLPPEYGPGEPTIFVEVISHEKAAKGVGRRYVPRRQAGSRLGCSPYQEKSP